ncbi:hypothetical protein ABUK73_03635 [Agrobacterium sp. BA1120]|uniref:hypothetical protein n=1 Tax=Agrobacterium sp. BA1120 TaxID=3228927 RepID=UPI00336AA4F0
MRKPAEIALLSIWVLVASSVLTHLWLTRPDWFPQFPQPLAEKLVGLYGAENAEQVADLELMIGFGISIPLTIVLTFVAFRLLRSR